MINRTKVKESTQIKPGDNGDVLVMKDNAPEWSTPSDADLAKVSETDAKLAEKQDKLTAGDNIKIEDNVISANGEPTPIAIGTVISGEVPMVSNSGTDTDVVLNFVLPKGDKGDKGDQGLEGPQGPVGAPFQIKKIYDSVEAMNADYSGSDVAVGEFVLIDTGDVQDPDNSKLYVKGPAQYDFVTDLSGAQGIQGPQGNPGTPAGFGNVTATVDSTTGTPQVSVQADGPNTAKNIFFSFTGLKGEKGDKGEDGKDGTQINSIAPLMVETPPVVGRGSIALGNDVQASRNDNNNIIVGNNVHLTDVDRNSVIVGELNDRTKSLMNGAVVVGMDNDVSKMNYAGSASAATTIIGAHNTFLDGWGDGSNNPSDHGNAVPNTARLVSVCGANNTINGAYSVVVGNSATAELERSVIVGYNSKVANKLEGNGPTHGGGVAIGSFCHVDNYSVAIGPNYASQKTITFDDKDLPSGYCGCNYGIAIGTDARSLSHHGLAIGTSSSVASAAESSAAIGAMSSATEPYTFSVGSGDATMNLTDDMDEETRERIQARAVAATRRIVNVTDPRDAQDAATKNYVDTQLTPINAKLQYVPENTNQVLSQIQTNVEKAQSAADAKVASITAGTGITVDDSNPTAPVISTTGLATQSDLTALQTTVTQLQETVTQLQSQLNNLTLEVEEI